jgi:hypothetical protein
MACAGRPSGGGGTDLAAWAIPALALVALVVGGALWLAGGLASLLAGAGWQSAPFTLTTLIRVLTEGPGVFWPHADPTLLAALTAALAGLVLVPAAVLGPAGLRAAARRRRPPPLPRPTNSPRPAAVRPRGRTGAAAAPLPGRGEATGPARRGRRGAARPPAHRQQQHSGAGPVRLLGGRRPRRHGPSLRKSTALAVPAALAAPGAVVVTSNKPDVWAATHALRREQTGEAVWTFDPQRVAHAPQTWWWNPLRGLTSVEEAERLAGHFVGTVEDERSRDIWGPAASELLASLLLAAAVSGGSLLDVYGWLSEEASPVPGGILRESGYPLLARALRGTQDSPPETRGSVYFTAAPPPNACATRRSPPGSAHPRARGWWSSPPRPSRCPSRRCTWTVPALVDSGSGRDLADVFVP